MAFINTLLSYLLLMLVILLVAAAAIIIGITMRKRKNASEQIEEPQNE